MPIDITGLIQSLQPSQRLNFVPGAEFFDAAMVERHLNTNLSQINSAVRAFRCVLNRQGRNLDEDSIGNIVEFLVGSRGQRHQLAKVAVDSARSNYLKRWKSINDLIYNT